MMLIEIANCVMRQAIHSARTYCERSRMEARDGRRRAARSRGQACRILSCSCQACYRMSSDNPSADALRRLALVGIEAQRARKEPHPMTPAGGGREAPSLQYVYFVVTSVPAGGPGSSWRTRQATSVPSSMTVNSTRMSEPGAGTCSLYLISAPPASSSFGS